MVTSKITTPNEKTTKNMAIHVKEVRQLVLMTQANASHQKVKLRLVKL